MLCLLLLPSLSACTSKKIPEWHGKVYIIKDQKIQRAQEKEVVPFEKAEGALVFLPGDADSFFGTYLGRCIEWDNSLPLDPSEEPR